MVPDFQTLVSNQQGAITASAGSTDKVNFGLVDPNTGKGKKKFLYVVVTEAGGGDGTVKFQVRDCDTEGGTFREINSSRAYVGTELTKGKVIPVPLPDEMRQYADAYYAVTGTVTGLKVMAWFG